MSLEEQVNKDYYAAGSIARTNRYSSAKRQRFRWACSASMISERSPEQWGESIGMRTVPVVQIGGSVGRCSEFDRDFSACQGERERKVEAHPGLPPG